ncbi:MAG: hypothetical protein COA70_10780 [Planctomycetota bacterium]|nr:MAG: hypothetical protein COA70_10780 [Planctomycetota bacterium]
MGGECSMGYLRTFRGHPSSYLEPRNPNYIRGWVEFTAPIPVKNKGFRVIVISNSQGFLRESPNGALSYPQQLETLLRENGYGENAEVLNWSIPGGACREEILLAARTVEHQPDVIILASYNNDFAPKWEKRSLTSIRSDVSYLAYTHGVRKYLPRSFIHQSGAFSPHDWLKSNSQFMAWHNRFVGPERLWSVRQQPRPTLLKRELLRLEYGVSPTLLNHFLDAAHAGKSNPNVLMVSMPLNAGQITNFQDAKHFYSVAQAVSSSWPSAQSIDASGLIPLGDFSSARHMKPIGHAKFAHFLFAQLPPPGLNGF